MSAPAAGAPGSLRLSRWQCPPPAPVDPRAEAAAVASPWSVGQGRVGGSLMMMGLDTPPGLLAAMASWRPEYDFWTSKDAQDWRSDWRTYIQVRDRRCSQADARL